MQQLITPNPNIPCKPGWCLQYVRQTFGLAGVHPSATAGWAASLTKHRDQNFPEGVWVPLWFFMEDEPLGHVVLRAPDGSIYSTTDLSTTPRRHPSLSDLMRIYAGAGLPLTYLGWTEDIEGVAVVDGSASLAYAGDITPETVQEDDMPITQADAELIADTLLGRKWQTAPNAVLGELLNEFRNQHLTVVKEVQDLVQDIFGYTVDGVAGDRLNLEQFLREYRSHVMQDQATSAAIVAAKAAASGASVEEIQKAVHDALASGVNINLSINGKEVAE